MCRSWQYQLCLSQCSVAPNTPTRCCIVPCCHKYNGILKEVTNENGVVQDNIDPNGLISSYSISVGNDTKWLPVITNAVTSCYQQYSENPDGYDCGVIPMNLYSIIDCSYNEQFLKCPNYNPHNLKECEYTLQYIAQCTWSEYFKILIHITLGLRKNNKEQQNILRLKFNK